MEHPPELRVPDSRNPLRGSFKREEEVRLQVKRKTRPLRGGASSEGLWESYKISAARQSRSSSRTLNIWASVCRQWFAKKKEPQAIFVALHPRRACSNLQWRMLNWGKPF